MAHQGTLNFHGAQAMAGHVDHVVYPTHHPEVAIRIAAGTIAREIDVTAISWPDVFPVTAAEPLWIAVHVAQHSRPGAPDRQITAGVHPLGHPFQVNNVSGDSRQGQGGRTWLGGGSPRQGTNHHSTSFGLPPGIDNWTAPMTNHIAVPHPGLWIDRFPHAAKYAQTAHVVAVRHLATVFHESPYRCGCGVKDRHPVLLDQLPKGTWIAWSRCAFIHHRGRPVGEGAINDIAMASDPADISCTPVNIVFLDVKNPLEGDVGP